VPGKFEPPLDLALRTMSEQLGLEEAQLTVMGVEMVDWPDASLGCPEPGAVYAQVMTRGYRFYFRWGDLLYSVHTDDAQRATLCLPPRRLPANPKGIDDGDPWLPVEPVEPGGMTPRPLE